MEDAVIEKLAVSGLDDFALPAADVESRGTNPTIVENACSELEKESANITSFISELDDAKKQLLLNWEGISADNFAGQFSQLIEAFKDIPKCVNSIAAWAEEVKDAYVKIDQSSF